VEGKVWGGEKRKRVKRQPIGQGMTSGKGCRRLYNSQGTIKRKDEAEILGSRGGGSPRNLKKKINRTSMIPESVCKCTSGARASRK